MLHTDLTPAEGERGTSLMTHGEVQMSVSAGEARLLYN